jgi:predicted thioesterase
MAEIPIGTKGFFQLLVTSDISINFLDNEQARVLGTPWMIAYLEITCRNSVMSLLEKGLDTVGTHVDIRHLAAAPLGTSVRFITEVLSVQDRRINFRVEVVTEDEEKIGEGTHERAVINVARFAAKMQEKLARRG